MSTAAISTSSIYQQLQAYFQQRRSDVQQLGQDLSAGNLSAAQQDYNSIETLGQSGPFANGVPFKYAPRAEDFTAIGQALQSGNLTGAQQAYTQLESTFDHQRPVRVGPNEPSSAGSTEASSGASSSTSTAESSSAAQSGVSTATPSAGAVGGPELILNLGNAPAGEQITIGLNNTGNGTEQLTLSVANGQNQTPEQIVFNLNQNSNEQIVLNLFNNTTTAATPSNVNLSA